DEARIAQALGRLDRDAVDHALERAHGDEGRELGIRQAELAGVVAEIRAHLGDELPHRGAVVIGHRPRELPVQRGIERVHRDDADRTAHRKCELTRRTQPPKLYPMQAVATQQSTTAVLPHRPVQWRRAARALWQMMGNYDSRLIMDYAVALEGDDGERGFQDF